jgi:hypothetical protein
VADQNCCFSFGGRITISIDGTAYAPTEADIEIEPTNISTEAKANQDGSGCFMAKPKLYKASFKLRNPCGIVWDDVLRKCSVDATIVEVDNNRTHLFTSSRFTGDIKVNLSTGEVDGGSIEGSRYQKIES